ncbi:MAG: serine/threonine protein kinase [Acidimicrobiales bacterium]
MQAILAAGQRIDIGDGGPPYVVDGLLGRGGQGEVYTVRRGPEAAPLALKWYFDHVAIPEQRESLFELIDVGSPSPRFLWPLAVATAEGVPGFGYLMHLRDAGFVGIVELVNGRATGITFRHLATIAFELAETFLQLHVIGHCYRDINFGNVFFNPTTGAVLICDVDNVGVNETRRFGAIGTPRFMAPEILTGAARPSTDTDRHSLAVLLFYVLMVSHPLEGKAALKYDHLDPSEALLELTGRHPVFIFDPDDPSNPPADDSAALIYWPLYPAFVRALFTRAFTTGLTAPSQRVTVTEWRAAACRLRDLIIHCQSCGRQSFLDPDRAAPPACWSCSTAIVAPPLIEIDHDPIALNADTKLYAHHILGRNYDFAAPLAEVAVDPADPQRWGLRNLSDQPWTATLPDGSSRAVGPGRAVPLLAEVAIDFGARTGTIRA